MASGRRLRRAFAHAVVATSIAAGAAAWTAAPRTAHADASFDQVLYGLINQDRASAGLPALRWNAQLSSIGEAAPYGGCGFTVLGRAQDMIQRHYFSHTLCATPTASNLINPTHRRDTTPRQHPPPQTVHHPP